MMTMALAIIIPLSMLIYSNSRITELKETLRAEMGQMKNELTLTMETRFNSVDRKLDEILRILGDHETRIARIEHPPR